MKKQQESLSPVAAPRLVRPSSYFDGIADVLRLHPNGTRESIVNLGAYRESKWQILWDKERIRLVCGDDDFAIPMDVLEVVGDLIQSALAGELESQKIHLDLC